MKWPWKRRWIYHVVALKNKAGVTSVYSSTIKASRPIDKPSDVQDIRERIKKEESADQIIIMNWVKLKG